MKSAERQRRALWVYSVAWTLGGALGLTLLITLRSLILPCVIGALLAYVSRPLLGKLKHWGLPSSAGTLVLFGGVILGIVVLIGQVRAVIPDQRGKLELRTRVQYKLTERYAQVMGRSEPEAKGNMLYTVLGPDADRAMHQVIGIIALDADERALLEHMFETDPAPGETTRRVQRYHLANIAKLASARGAGVAVAPALADSAEASAGPPVESHAAQLGAVFSIASLWIVTPFVFLFLLMDNGAIKRFAVAFVPNRYFEMTLTVINSVDQAIGRYLRGTLLECSLVGLSFAVGLFVVGVDVQWALIIGILAGASNAIPFLGPVIGLVIGVGYALIAEEVHPLIPGITPDNLVIGVLGTVAVAQLLDNAVFQPVVLGGVVNLHPLVVIIGVMGGSILFGFAGMLFAIPAIVVVRVVVETVFRQLHAYRII